jgi:hypothetical protein
VGKVISNFITPTPKRLFLLDSMGALLTACMLVVILASFEETFGMPPKTLYALAIVACVFAIYSISCYFFVKKNWRPFLKGIALANLAYCCISLFAVYYYFERLTNLGLIYFLIEVMVVLGLIRIELFVVANSN